MEDKIKEIQNFNYNNNDKYNQKIINEHGYYTGSSDLDFNNYRIYNNMNNLYLYYCDYVKFNEPYNVINDDDNNDDLKNTSKDYEYYTINNVYLHHCHLIIFNHLNIKNLYLNNAFVLNYDIQLLYYRFNHNREKQFNQYCRNHQIEINNIYIKLIKSRISLYEGKYENILNYHMIKNIKYVEILINHSFIKIYNILKSKWNNNDLIFYDLLYLFPYYHKEFDIDYVIVYLILLLKILYKHYQNIKLIINSYYLNTKNNTKEIFNLITIDNISNIKIDENSKKLIKNQKGLNYYNDDNNKSIIKNIKEYLNNREF